MAGRASKGPVFGSRSPLSLSADADAAQQLVHEQGALPGRESGGRGSDDGVEEQGADEGAGDQLRFDVLAQFAALPGALDDLVHDRVAARGDLVLVAPVELGMTLGLE